MKAAIPILSKIKIFPSQSPTFPKILEESANSFNPAIIANYTYELAKLFNQFYNECSVLKENNQSIQDFRIKLIESTAQIIKNSMECLGIIVPERM